HPSPPQNSGLSFPTLHIARQELVSSLRDRQTVQNSIVLPIVMYPLLFWVILQGFLVVKGHQEQTQVDIGLVGDPGRVAQVQADMASLMPEGTKEDPIFQNVKLVTHADIQDDEQIREWLTPLPQGVQASEDEPEKPDAVLLLQGGEEGTSTLYTHSTRSHSELANDRAVDLIRTLVGQYRNQAAQAAGLDPGALDPLDVSPRAVTTRKDKGALALSMILPMMIVIMAVMGAFFPAVDLTAGEKERGTSETTLLLPIPRAKVLTGKILACTALAFVATTLNLTSMGLAARHLLASLGPNLPIEIQFPFKAVLFSLPIILLFCFFVSATLTALAGLTKTFKEGQAMLGPAQMVFMLPAVIGVMPGLQLNEIWALVPVVNVVLAIRSILVMESLPIPYALTALSLLASAWIAVRLCIRILSLEALAFAGSSMSLKHLLSRKAR
ncbi:MAG: ABC transporter permease subunit, partial [Planctomycetota bacterium]|nr:ABC transporter permease subunit [Planctomycetota bacterium]